MDGQSARDGFAADLLRGAPAVDRRGRGGSRIPELTDLQRKVEAVGVVAEGGLEAAVEQTGVQPVQLRLSSRRSAKSSTINRCGARKRRRVLLVV